MGGGALVRRSLTVSVLVVMLVATAPTLLGTAANAQTGAGGPGRLGWCELLTHDSAAAAQFYAALFGWQLESHASGKYRLVDNGAVVGGITQISETTPELDETTWLVGITVDDVGDSVDAARRRGGKILADVTRAKGGGEWAVVEDLQGAQLLILSGGQEFDGGSGPGRWMWTELWTTDQEAAVTFYGEVVGWSLQDIEHPDGAYPAFFQGGEARAGLVPIAGERVGPGWAPYVGVTDLGAILKRAIELGGQVLLEPNDETYGGRVAVLADPTGVGFLAYELEEVSE